MVPSVYCWYPSKHAVNAIGQKCHENLFHSTKLPFGIKDCQLKLSQFKLYRDITVFNLNNEMKYFTPRDHACPLPVTAGRALDVATGKKGDSVGSARFMQRIRVSNDGLG